MPQQISANRFDAYAAIQSKARSMISAAVAKGIIHRNTSCQECGKDCCTQAHHEDYSRPYHVTWLCVKCHGKRPKRRVYVDIDISQWPHNHRSAETETGPLRVSQEIDYEAIK
mgnify:CR=1 FL=1